MLQTHRCVEPCQLNSRFTRQWKLPVKFPRLLLLTRVSMLAQVQMHWAEIYLCTEHLWFLWFTCALNTCDFCVLPVHWTPVISVFYLCTEHLWFLWFTCALNTCDFTRALNSLDFSEIYLSTEHLWFLWFTCALNTCDFTCALNPCDFSEIYLVSLGRLL